VIDPAGTLHQGGRALRQMTRRWPIVWVLALALLLAVDAGWYKPRRAAQAESEHQRGIQCQRLLQQFQREGRDPSTEQRPGGRLEGCRFGAPLG
jgi:hypothetical protein